MNLFVLLFDVVVSTTTTTKNNKQTTNNNKQTNKQQTTTKPAKPAHPSCTHFATLTASLFIFKDNFRATD
jgi:hypothetical protein